MHRLFLAALAAVVAIPLFAAAAAIPDRSAALRGVEYIRTTQLADGGFGAPGQTMDAIYAIRSAGLDPNTFVKSGKTPADFLRANAAAATKPAVAAKFALAGRALGLDPRNVAGTDLVAAVQAGFAPSTGRFADDDFSQSISMLGLACVGTPTPSTAILALRKAQLADGGWGFGGASDPDTTAIAIQALAASGVPAGDSMVAKAVAYLRSSQAADGGWGFGADSNASSTAYVVQALLAAGEQPDAPAYLKGKATPVTFLLSQQDADGSFKGFDAAFATNQAVPALAGRSFCDAATTPIRPTPSASAPLPPATGTGAARGSRFDGADLAIVSMLAIAFAASVLAFRRSFR